MDARPICHEAGHLIVGLHFDFRIERLEIAGGKPRVVCDLDAVERSSSERYIFLAGGIAGEKFGIGNYDPVPCRADQQQITERGGESIDTYLTEAVQVIAFYERCFGELRKQIICRAIEKTMQMAITGGENSFELLSDAEIQRTWEAYHQRRA
jgi:hypothetical protein